jgi:MoxR-like ATPase
MPSSPAKTTQNMPATLLANALAAANRIILGKDRQIRLALACLLANGHLLIEDLPGVGKTTLAHTLARLLGLDFQRLQFTSDMLPADIVGTSIWDREHSRFQFLPGPVFTQLVLADEINRATPKTQSALLEAMEERQVTAEGETRPLPLPFFVVATQNPSHQIGTFPLPESQLDRFLMRIELGYPDVAAERALLEGGDRRDAVAQLQPCLTPAQLLQLQAAIQSVHVAPALLDYLQALVAATRNEARFAHGLSPRAALALLACARAWACIAGRDAVLPEDVQAIFPSVARHRLHLASSGSPANDEDIAALLRAVVLP